MIERFHGIDRHKKISAISVVPLFGCFFIPLRGADKYDVEQDTVGSHRVVNMDRFHLDPFFRATEAGFGMG